jgi:hypothetical protein
LAHIRNQSAASLGVLASLAAGVALPSPSFGQTVADRTLSDVRVDNAGGCTTLTVNFNIRVQVLSSFPESGGRELHVRLRPLDTGAANQLRESLRTPSSVPDLRSIEYEGDNASGPVLSLLFTHDMRFEVSAGSQPQSIVIKLAQPHAGPLCDNASPAVASTTSAPGTGLASEADKIEVARLIAEAEVAIRDGNSDRAVQLLTNATAKPETADTARAIELLGLTRERKGQLAHAQAEYEGYLRRFPTGDGAERVRQRLAAITAANPGVTPNQELRAASGSTASPADWTWSARGSFSQFYFRDQSTIKIPDAVSNGANTEVDNSVNVNQLLTTADMTISGGNDRRQLQLRAAGSYNKNFGTSTTTTTKGNTTFRSRPGAGIKALTALYLDYSDKDLDGSVRLGRQTRNSAGVLGRFDGLLVGWQATPKVRINAVGGFPVLTSRQTFVLKDRWFYGASVDLGSKRSALQTTVYWFDQHARGGFIDRRSVGVEARVLKKRFNAYAIVDYDVKFSRLNLGLLTLNYNFPDNSNLSLTADYRQSPLLTTNNALIGQADPVTFAPIPDLQGLKPFFTDAQIYQLARDRTLVAKSATVSYSRPLTKKLQANLDFTLTDTGGTPASGGIEALPATGKEYYYGAQIVGSGMFWSNDIYILSGRYADSQRARTYTGDFNARIPVTDKVRISPRVRYGYRSDKLIDSTYSQLQPTLRLNYFPLQHSEVEIEFGGNFTRQTTNTAGLVNKTSEKGWVLSAGYRIDF